MSSGLTLNGRVGSQYDLVGRYVDDTRLQAIQTKLLWPNAIDGREPTVRRSSILDTLLPALLQARPRATLRHKHGRVPPRITADTTSVGFGEILAYRASLDGFHRLQKYVAQRRSTASVTL